MATQRQSSILVGGGAPHRSHGGGHIEADGHSTKRGTPSIDEVGVAHVRPPVGEDIVDIAGHVR